MTCDILIPAIGQITWVDDESVGMHRTSAFKVSKAFEIDIPGVFAAGAEESLKCPPSFCLDEVVEPLRGLLK